jgi:diguanylate cyclase (GGDEF)-like protein
MLQTYRESFAVIRPGDDDVAKLGASLFGETPDLSADTPDFSAFSFDYVSQGEEAVRQVRDSVAAGRPYSVLLLDMRMPPGIDGKETARRVREIDQNINIVVVTGYSDHSPLSVAKVAGPFDKLYYLSKPFSAAEIQQLALSLSSKWNLERNLKAAQSTISRQFDELQQAHVNLSASEARTRHMALHDQLTRLPNRRHFHEYLEKIVQHARESVSVLFVDLDHFKNVNDSLGHAAGDELIRIVGERIRQDLPEGALLARLGGDEFAIALTGVAEVGAVQIAESIIAKCTGEFEIMGTRVHIGASVGIATAPPGSANVAEILRQADLALYAAKHSGRAVVRLFSPELDDSAQFRATIAKGLRKAMSENSLRLVYQPIIVPDSGKPYGYEALLRWSDNELGDVPPAIFVPIAEQCGLAKQLGEWVISNALAECATWAEGMISINVSPHHFQSRNLVQFITARTAERGVRHDRIQFEITETAMFTNPAHAAEVIRELRSSGIRIALDDFGTGYSSLVNLRDFEIDCIKIDKSFVDTLGEERQASAIITSVTAMARMLGVNVVAEGVESASQVQALRALGCSLMQGYYYSVPMNAADLPYPPGHAEQLAGQAGKAA